MTPMLLALALLAADPFPYFKPDPKVASTACRCDGQAPALPDPPPARVVEGPVPPHPQARECAVDDRECVELHNRRVLEVAITAQDPGPCALATSPPACREALAMTMGEAPPSGRLDPCLWVASIKAGTATLLDTVRDRVLRVPARAGWKAHAFVGACGVQAAGQQAE